jgi:DNA ligase-1
LQRRLGRKAPGKSIRAEEPVHLVVFDCLERNGRDLRGLPLSERRIALEQVLEEAGSARLHRSEVVPFSDFADLDRLRQTARERGVEGLMLKRRESAYGVGRPRGDWWKHKVDPYVLDAVLIYAQAGSGRRANLFTDYTFALWKDDELVPFAKAYSGLSNAEIAELDRWIRRHTVQKYGPARAVSPEQVFEIAFEGVAESGRHKSGVAVRFPRIHRWRRKKKAAEADRVESLWKLIS